MLIKPGSEVSLKEYDPDDTGELITTFPGVGYRMELPGTEH